MKEKIDRIELPKDNLQLSAWCIEKVMQDKSFIFFPRDDYFNWVIEKAQELYNWCKAK